MPNDDYECPNCNGTGRTAAFMADFSEPCAPCRGSGRVHELPEGRCPTCGGRGTISTQADTNDTCQTCQGSGSTNPSLISEAYLLNH